MNILKAPAFVLCCVAFLAHQILQKLFLIQVRFLDDYLDNLLITPILLTFLVVERRVLFKQGPSYQLSVLEVVMGTVFIALVCELLFPFLSDRFVTDWKDIIFYALGSIVFYFAINPWPRK